MEKRGNPEVDDGECFKTLLGESPYDTPPTHTPAPLFLHPVFGHHRLERVPFMSWF